ncbi:hypothetical protein TNCV_2177001 [Trichonephila clavipes]|uniref:Uncharacterized protein n=1 Tax=Trichonephila clavipes TaxID=2585209 RepID=A0A8X6VTZ5_TRICX|nr:hypothetical protein TNCV_2177001 [Trichonephila clavipes]
MYVLGHMIRKQVQGQKLIRLGGAKLLAFIATFFFLFSCCNSLSDIQQRWFVNKWSLINLSYADITKLIEASDSEEEVSKHENHTSNEYESESSDNNFDTNNQQMNYKESIQFQNRKIKGIHFHSFLNQQLLIL